MLGGGFSWAPSTAPFVSLEAPAAPVHMFSVCRKINIITTSMNLMVSGRCEVHSDDVLSDTFCCGGKNIFVVFTVFQTETVILQSPAEYCQQQFPLRIKQPHKLPSFEVGDAACAWVCKLQ